VYSLLVIYIFFFFIFYIFFYFLYLLWKEISKLSKKLYKHLQRYKNYKLLELILLFSCPFVSLLLKLKHGVPFLLTPPAELNLTAKKNVTFDDCCILTR